MASDISLSISQKVFGNIVIVIVIDIKITNIAQPSFLG
jgi:hypothetical protein